MPKERLFDGLFGFENADVGTNTIELYVARLRKKLSGSGVVIETHRGLGYRLDLDG
jgi:two-component system response regulator TctD